MRQAGSGGIGCFYGLCLRSGTAAECWVDGWGGGGKSADEDVGAPGDAEVLVGLGVMAVFDNPLT